MLPLTPQLLVSTATAFAACRVIRQIQQADDRTAAETIRDDASLRFVHFAGFWSHFTHHSSCSSWPLPLSPSIEELAEFAEERRGLTPTPRAGDVFLLASPKSGRHVLAGIVAAVETVRTLLNGGPGFICTTIEGEVDVLDVGDVPPSLRMVRLVRRRLSPALGDCFIRWSELAAYSVPAAVENQIPEKLVRIRQRAA